MDTKLTLRIARGRPAQQAAIDAWLSERRAAAESGTLAVIAEGAFFELKVPADATLERLAAGCVCCVGLVPLKVTLTRVLRRHPAAVLLLVTDADHSERLRAIIASGELGVREAA